MAVLTPPYPPFQGDLKRYLRAQRPPEGLSPELPPRDLRTLQRMGLEIARGLAHLHSHNYVHRCKPGSPRAWGDVCVCVCGGATQDQEARLWGCEVRP